MRDLTLDEVVMLTVFKRLKKLNWNRTRAADSLDISIRGMRLYIGRLKALGVEVPENQGTNRNLDISKRVVEMMRSDE